jgi:hypothetical protein
MAPSGEAVKPRRLANTWSIAAGDLNGDGRIDVVGANGLQNGSVSVMLGNGDATFRDVIELDAGVVPASVSLADLNGDAHPEILIANEDLYSHDPTHLRSNRARSRCFPPRATGRSRRGRRFNSNTASPPSSSKT